MSIDPEHPLPFLSHQYAQLVLVLGASVDGGVLGNRGRGGGSLLLTTTRRGDGNADGREDSANGTVLLVCVTASFRCGAAGRNR
jgi:hypothetical protein